ncbi:MAG: hypothetical protein AAGF49_01115, partial [Pseudomonadota bacterium]
QTSKPHEVDDANMIDLRKRLAALPNNLLEMGNHRKPHLEFHKFDGSRVFSLRQRASRIGIHLAPHGFGIGMSLICGGLSIRHGPHPLGGVKRSGNGSEDGVWSLDFCGETKNVCVRL